MLFISDELKKNVIIMKKKYISFGEKQTIQTCISSLFIKVWLKNKS